MKKLRLEDLKVESFSTSAEGGGLGTVRGFLFATDPDACAVAEPAEGDKWSDQYTCNPDRHAECKTDGYTSVHTCKFSCRICNEAAGELGGGA